jgi:hypothetical protein
MGDNPYGGGIDDVGIGGFPLLPGRKNCWLKDFLSVKFGTSNIRAINSCKGYMFLCGSICISKGHMPPENFLRSNSPLLLNFSQIRRQLRNAEC